MKTIDLQVEQIAPDRAVVTIPPDLLEGVDNVYLRVDYVGDIGNCFAKGKLVSDNFYNGSVWELGLKQILLEAGADELFFLITPKRAIRQPSGESMAMAFTPDTSDRGEAVIGSITAVAEYRVALMAESGGG